MRSQITKQQQENQNRAIVIFDSGAGTDSIAKSLEAGLRKAGLETDCVNVNNVLIDSLEKYDLVCMGASTKEFATYKLMRSLLRRLEALYLRGRFAFAFDVRIDSPLSGDVSKRIESALKGLGLEIIAPRASAIIGTNPSRLREGEQEIFEQIGKHLGIAVSRANMIQA
jgi:flavorubredoxin